MDQGLKSISVFRFSFFFRFSRENLANNLEYDKDQLVKKPLSSVECLFGTDEQTDAGISLIYDGEKNSQVFGDFMSYFIPLTENSIFSLYITQNDYRSEDVYSLYVFHMPYQKNIEHQKQ